MAGIDGAGIKAWRGRAGLSVVELAQTLRVSRHTVYAWEGGETEPPYFLGYALNYLGAHAERWVRRGVEGAGGTV